MKQKKSSYGIRLLASLAVLLFSAQLIMACFHELHHKDHNQLHANKQCFLCVVFHTQNYTKPNPEEACFEKDQGFAIKQTPILSQKKQYHPLKIKTLSLRGPPLLKDKVR